MPSSGVQAASSSPGPLHERGAIPHTSRTLSSLWSGGSKVFPPMAGVTEQREACTRDSACLGHPVSERLSIGSLFVPVLGGFCTASLREIKVVSRCLMSWAVREVCSSAQVDIYAAMKKVRDSEDNPIGLAPRRRCVPPGASNPSIMPSRGAQSLDLPASVGLMRPGRRAA